MRIQFSHSNGGGPAVFMRRLRKYFVKHYGVIVTDDAPHLYISAVWRGSPPKGAKTIHRVDNCYFDKLNKGRDRANANIKKAVMKANGVIYQSEFSLKLCKHILGTKGSTRTIIHNGFDQSICDSVIPIENDYKHLFVACAVWRKLKRPKSIMRAFRQAAIPHSGLVMIGAGVEQPEDKNIMCIGKTEPEEIYRYYKAATAIVHISRLDSCPNTVVEALSFGKPVICNNAGGTKEIVGKDGIVAEIDPPDTYKPFSMKHTDSVDIKKVSEAMRTVTEKEWDISRADLDMSYCAQRYFEFFARVFNQ